MRGFRASAGCSSARSLYYKGEKGRHQQSRAFSAIDMAAPPPSSLSMQTSLSSSSATPCAFNNAHIETVISYHDRTKHFFNKYADGPHGLDWANQPEPFRRYTGSPVINLDHFPPSSNLFNDLPYSNAFQGSVEVAPLSKASLSQLLYHSFALSAWKTSGFSTWGLRVNPSSGNLHPTEAYVISDAIEGISDTPFVAHYYPKQHALEIRCELPSDMWMDMRKGFSSGVMFMGLTSIYWREAWKYGERAFRYCNHDVGHALGAISIAGAGLGWDAILLNGWGTDELDYLLGTYDRKSVPAGSPRQGRYAELEQEHADCLVACFSRNHITAHEPVMDSLEIAVPCETLVQMTGARMPQMHWRGIPNKLSKNHVWWQVIDQVSLASRKPTMAAQMSIKPWPSQSGMDVYKSLTLWAVILRRRSAVNMDRSHSMSVDAFYQILLKCLPSGPRTEFQSDNAQVPFRVLPSNAEVHMAIFVHRVIGLPKGLYILVRNSEHEQRLRQAFRQDFLWEKPSSCPHVLPFFKLAEFNCEKIAMQVSCFQEIAGFGCFSLGMIARFESIKERGPWIYPQLFWESGVLGQLLYLEAHAIGISATGIGCYFDDAVHQILGLKGKEFQSLYHFTVGTATEDKRITGLPPYPAPV